MQGKKGPGFDDLRGAGLRPILALNNLHAEQTSMLDEVGLASLIAMACYARGTERGATALLIALDQDAGYDNPNFSWLRARYDRFVYVDRIVVSHRLRGQGVGRLLYENLFAWTSQAGHNRVVCEVNLRPPNAGSDAFHAAMGFAEIGRAEILDGKKSVRYLEKLMP